MAKIADLLGQPLMPWQRQVADVGCELDENGVPAYREVIVTVPRQSGKTALFLAWQIDRCVNWGVAQRSVFTAQTGKDARDKWLDELFPLLRNSKLAPLITRINQGMGNEAIYWKTGSIIRLLSTSTSSGHSKTLDQAVMDEIWHDADDRREQGLRPAMITRPDAQLLVCSTAGTQGSTVYNRKVQMGRTSVAADSGRGVAYFEWSAPDGWDPADEDSWWEFMPALGHTIGVDQIRDEKDSLPAGEFLRAYGNRPTATVDRIIPAPLWERVCDPSARPDGKVRFGVDVAEDRSTAAVVACDGRVCELVEHREGTGWLVERVNELVAAHDTSVALDAGGPAASFADELTNCRQMKSGEVLKACGALFDAVVNTNVVFRTDGAFDQAAAGAVKRTSGDMWAWSRKGSISDVTPLMAATLAWAAPGPVSEPFVLVG